jgi:hypothetical protein
MPTDDEPFYIGYLPKAPAATRAFMRRVVAIVASVTLAVAAALAITLRYAGTGRFEFGSPREVLGIVRCEPEPRIESTDTDYLLVGYGKNRVAPEICGAAGQEVVVRGTLIQREGKQLLEVTSPARRLGPAADESAAMPLGRFTLRGEIVDSKCYFGVMNPGEGRAHRACAELCLRGGVPAIFVTRDKSGATTHLIMSAPDGMQTSETLLPWVGEPVEITGDVVRRGKWLVLRFDLQSLRRV